MRRVLGISGRDRQAAAALMADGRVVAAAREDAFLAVHGIGYAAAGGFPLRATMAVLRAGQVALEQVEAIAMVRSTGDAASAERIQPLNPGPVGEDLEALAHALEGRTVVLVDSAEAQARQALLTAPDGDALVVVLDESDGPVAAAFRRRGGTLDVPGAADGFGALTSAAAAVARMLGCQSATPWSALSELAGAHDPTAPSAPGIADTMRWTAEQGFEVDVERLIALLLEREQHFPEPLSARASVHLPLQNERAAIAHACVSCLGTLVRRMIDELANPGERVLLAGSVAAHPAVACALSGVAPLPAGLGGAVGAAAAVSDQASTQTLADLRLGPAFTEGEIKAAIEHCRLDYVYEPQWSRLLERVSVMLEAGKLVGWFQGCMEFGSRALGGRGVLADPSNPYARNNIGLLLRRHPGTGGFPVSVPGSSTAEAVGVEVHAPFGGHQITIDEPHAQWCAAALDAQRRLTVHTVSGDAAPELLQLLQLHAGRTGVPGLINLPLCDVNDSRVCTPLDAVRTMFTTPLDALVCGRFLLMKDYWLLRAPVPAAPAVRETAEPRRVAAVAVYS